MNLKITGNHIDISDTLRQYITDKLERITRHVDSITAIHVILSAEKLTHKISIDVHLKGRDIHVEATDAEIHAAVDAIIDRLDRQVIKYKEKMTEHHAHQSPSSHDLT